MCRWLFLGALVVLGAIACGDGSPPPPAQPPPAKVVEPEPEALLVARPGLVVLGVITEDEPAKLRFTVTNTGSRAVKISSVDGSCGCARHVARVDGEEVLPPFELAPDQKLQLSLELRADGGSGPRSEWIRLTSDQHPRLPHTWMRVNCTFEADMELSPDTLALGRVRRGRPVTREVRVVIRRPSIGVKDVWTSATWLRARIEDNRPATDARPGGARIVVELGADAPLGPHEQAVEIHTTHEGRHRKRRVLVTATVIAADR